MHWQDAQQESTYQRKEFSKRKIKKKQRVMFRGEREVQVQNSTKFVGQFDSNNPINVHHILHELIIQ